MTRKERFNKAIKSLVRAPKIGDKIELIVKSRCPSHVSQTYTITDILYLGKTTGYEVCDKNLFRCGVVYYSDEFIVCENEE